MLIISGLMEADRAHMHMLAEHKQSVRTYNVILANTGLPSACLHWNNNAETVAFSLMTLDIGW